MAAEVVLLVVCTNDSHGAESSDSPEVLFLFNLFNQADELIAGTHVRSMFPCLVGSKEQHVLSGEPGGPSGQLRWMSCSKQPSLSEICDGQPDGRKCWGKGKTDRYLHAGGK